MPDTNAMKSDRIKNWPKEERPRGKKTPGVKVRTRFVTKSL